MEFPPAEFRLVEFLPLDFRLERGSLGR